MFVYNDGGRAQAGFQGKADDCVCRSVAIVTGKPYHEIYALINDHGKTERKTKRRKSGKSSARTGVYKATTRKILTGLGFNWTPTMGIGTGCKIHLKAGELPPGRLVVSVSKHITAVIDGVVHDTYDPTRDGTRCVYGYWTT